MVLTKRESKELISKSELARRASEFEKCMANIIYFAENYFYIISLDRGKVLIKPYEKQKELIEAMMGEQRTIVLASRQSGKTTAYTIFALHYCCFNEEKKVLICANKEKTAIGFLKRIKTAYHMLPEWLRPKVKVWNEKTIEFENGCEISIVATSSDAARSYSINCLIGSTTICARIGGELFEDIAIEKLLKKLKKTVGVKLEVLTDEGWCEFDGISDNGIRSDLVELNESLVCTEDHKIFCTDGKWEAKDCSGKRSFTYNGTTAPISIKTTDEPQRVYDLINVKNSKHSFFVNGGSFLVSNCLILDELAFVPRNIVEEFWTSVMPIVSSSTTSKIIVVSTHNGIGTKFYELWQEANLSESTVWHPHRVDWWDVPGKDEEWKRKEIASYGPDGERKFSQEYGNEALGSAPTLLDRTIFNRLIETEKTNRLPVDIWKLGNDKLGFFDIKVWKKPLPGHAYVLGGDVGEGIGGDHSWSKIFDITNLLNIEEVASFGSNYVSGPTLAFIMVKMAMRYNYAYIACERNGVSLSAIDAIWKIFEYENIVDIGSNKFATGIFSNHATKSEACFYLRELLKSKNFSLILRDRDTLLELERFERIKAKSTVTYAAISGHDDRVMATIWAIFTTKTDILEKYYDVVTTGFDPVFGHEVPLFCRSSESALPGSDNYFDGEESFNTWKDDYTKMIDQKAKMLAGDSGRPNGVEEFAQTELMKQKQLPPPEDDLVFASSNGNYDEDF